MRAQATLRALERAQGAARHRPHPRPLGAGGAHDPRLLERAPSPRTSRRCCARPSRTPSRAPTCTGTATTSSSPPPTPTRARRSSAGAPAPAAASPASASARVTSRSSSRRERRPRLAVPAMAAPSRAGRGAEAVEEPRDGRRGRDAEEPSRSRGAEEPTRPKSRAAETEAEADGRRRPRRAEQLMGQKIHPGGLRVGVIHDWKSNWYTGKKEFARLHPRGRPHPRAHLQASSRTRACPTS